MSSIATHFSLDLMRKYSARSPRVNNAKFSTPPQTTTTTRSTRAEIASECRCRGLKVGGNKAQLLARLTGEPGGRSKRRSKIQLTLKNARRILGQSCTPNINASLDRSKTACRSAFMARDGTLKYEVAKMAVDYWSKTQPKFTPKDAVMKQKIWNYRAGHCAFSDAPVTGVGDHMIGMREGFSSRVVPRFPHFGTNDQWNKIPCAPGYNSGSKCWKKLLLNGELRWITYSEFTPEELTIMKETLPDKWRHYNCWLTWKKYSESRGAKLSYPDMSNRDKVHALILESGMIPIDVRLKESFEMTEDEINAQLPKLEGEVAAKREWAKKSPSIRALTTALANAHARIAVLEDNLEDALSLVSLE
jgi:hypothetical protein